MATSDHVGDIKKNIGIDGEKGPLRRKKPDNRSEDTILLFFALLGLVGSVVLYYLKLPSIMTSVFLSMGVSALVYRFLGGIEVGSFNLGPLKVGGSLAALIGVALWMNNTRELDPQYKFHVPTQDVIAGDWDWKAVGPNTGVDGHLDFIKASDHRFTFTGEEYTLEAGANGEVNHKPLFEMTNGKAILSPDGTALKLDSDVVNLKYGRNFHWESTQPLVIIAAFGGQLWPTTGDANLQSQPWGILITKNTAVSH